MVVDVTEHALALKAWRDAHPDEWEYMKNDALSQAAEGRRRVSAKDLVEAMRRARRVKFNNNWTAALARVLEAEHPELAGMFVKKHASADGVVA